MFTRERSLRWKDERVGLYANNRWPEELAAVEWGWASITNRRALPTRQPRLVWQPVERHWSLSLGDWINRNRGPFRKSPWRPRFEELILPYLNDTRVWAKFDIRWSALTFVHYGSVTVVVFGFEVRFQQSREYRRFLVSTIPGILYQSPFPVRSHQWGYTAYAYVVTETKLEHWHYNYSPRNKESIYFRIVRVLDKDGNHSWKSRPKPRFGNCPDNPPDMIDCDHKSIYKARQVHKNYYNTSKPVNPGPTYEPHWRFNLSKINYKRIRLRNELGNAVANGDTRKRRRIEKELALTLPILVE